MHKHPIHKKKSSHNLMKGGLALLVIFAFIAFISAQSGKVSEGEQLEKQLWADFKAKNWSAIESRIATGFQSVHEDGARDREGELRLIKNLNISDYDLADFKVTQSGDAIMVTYRVSTQETIDKTQLSPEGSPRLSVWQKTGTGWQWVAHANLEPIK